MSGYVVYTKDGCGWCERAKDLLDSSGHAFETRRLKNVAELHRALGDDSVSTFPQIVHDGVLIGTYDHLQDYLGEPVLSPDIGTRRFTPFPLKYHDLWGMYKKAVASFWTVEEISLVPDQVDWKKLTDDERHFVKHVLAFFAGADGIVMENIHMNFGVEVKVPEARCFYAFQAYNESQHSEMYALLIDALIDDATEKDRLFRAIETMPAVRRKATWAMKWMDPSRRFAERLVAFACVEGIMFSGSFCSVFWLKQRGLMPGLGLSNQFISRDEGLHQQFAEMLYGHLRRKPSPDVVEAIVCEAVEDEKEFITDAIPCRLLGMNSDLMSQYIEFVADRLLMGMGYPPKYRAANPFPWMELISLTSKSNFFEKFESEYQKAGVMASARDQVFATDGEF